MLLKNIRLERMYKLLIPILISNFKRLNFPYKLTFAITYTCNSKCQICNIWKKKSVGEFTTSEIKKIATKNRFPWINITGGEPFLRMDISKIVEYFIEYSKPFLINFTTNGKLTEKIVDDVLSIIKRDKKTNIVVTISLDGPKELHNRLRGINVWDDAINTFIQLKEISKNEKNLRVYFGYTVSQFNYNAIEETYFSVKKKYPELRRSDFHFNFVHISESFYMNKNLKIPTFFKKISYNNMCSFFKKCKKTDVCCYIDKKYIKYLKYYMKYNITPLPCKALNASLFLDPYGNVFPCTHFGIKLGNLRNFNYRIKNIWIKKTTKNIWKKIRVGKCPHCWTPCEAYQTLFGNLIKFIL